MQPTNLVELKELKSLPPLLEQVAVQTECVIRLLQLDGNAVIQKVAQGPIASQGCLSEERCHKIVTEWLGNKSNDGMTCLCGHALTVLPIYYRGQVNGILTVCPTTPEARPYLTSLANVISNCLSLARSSVALWSEHSDLLTAHKELYRETESLTDAEAVPEVALRIIQKYLAADVALYVRRNAADTGWGRPIVLNNAGASEEWVAALSRVVTKSHEQDQCPLIILEENKSGYPQFAELNLSSFISATVSCESKSLGRMAFCSRGSENAFTISDLSLLENLVSTIGLRIHDLRNRKLKERFLERAMHQINTPAHSVREIARVLTTNKDLPAEMRESWLADLSEEAERLVRLVQQAREFSLFQKPTRPRVAVSLDRIVKDIAGQVGRLASQRQITIEASVPDENCEIVADAEAIYAALQSLVENALKFSPTGAKIRITLSEGKTDYRVSVIDQGPGVPESQRAEIFEELVSIARGTVRESTGLGLAIARVAVENHAGTLTCTDAPEKPGACFSFTLPRTEGS
ncbi:MAG TPA: HAMP domain-containing sensor histidine kinase [Pyrinomonadaceae bacterium]